MTSDSIHPARPPVSAGEVRSPLAALAAGKQDARRRFGQPKKHRPGENVPPEPTPDDTLFGADSEETQTDGDPDSGHVDILT